MGIHQAMFYGSATSNAVPLTTGIIWRATYTNFGVAGSEIVLQPSGTVASSGSGTPTSIETPNWYNPTTTNIGNSYWVRATLLNQAGGVATGTPLNTWLSLSISRGWGVNTSGDPDAFRTLLLEFSLTSDGSNIIGSGAIDLLAVDTSA